MKIFQGEELPQPKSMLLVSVFFLPWSNASLLSLSRDTQLNKPKTKNKRKKDIGAEKRNFPCISLLLWWSQFPSFFFLYFALFEL